MNIDIDDYIFPSRTTTRHDKAKVLHSLICFGYVHRRHITPISIHYVLINFYIMICVDCLSADSKKYSPTMSATLPTINPSGSTQHQLPNTKTQ